VRFTPSRRDPVPAFGCVGTWTSADAGPLAPPHPVRLRDQHTASGPKGPGKIDRRDPLVARGGVGMRWVRGTRSGGTQAPSEAIPSSSADANRLLAC
jgi:hypothetical protein